MVNKIKIILAGGHAGTTAIATVEELLRRQKKDPWEIYWIGAKSAVEGKNILPVEAEVFPKLGVRYHQISAGRLQRKFSLWTIPSLLKVPLGVVQAIFLILKIRPNLILSFGGFAAGPVVLASWLVGVPIIIHEQTTAAGLTNRLSSPFARVVALAREESTRFFPKEKCRLVGNPVLTQIVEIAPKQEIGVPPTILIFGGSRGSQAINEAVEPILEQLLKNYHLVHLTGPLDFAKFADRKKRFAGRLRNNYEVYPAVDPMKIDNIYRVSDIVVSRAGANTVSEIMLTKRPAILIPIPWSYLDEQNKNAALAQKFGVAEVISQDKLTPQTLLKAINAARDNWQAIVARVKTKESPDKLASQKLADILEENLK